MKMLNFLFVFIFLFIINTQAWAHKTYSVKKGDSLYKISRKFNIGIKDLKEANNLPSDKLPVGLKLIIPSIESNEEEYATENISSSDKEEEIIYTVKKGDSLWEIARKSNLSVKELKRLNSIKSNRIKPGQKLIVGYRVVEGEPEANVAEQIKELTESPEVQSLPVKERMVLFAKKMLGVPYKFGSNTLNRIDCSAYVQKVFGFIGIPLPRTAREQFSVGEFVNKENLAIGDLVFFKTYATFPSHVGIYIGDNLFIHTSTVTRNVTIDSLNTPYYLKRFVGAKRLLF